MKKKIKNIDSGNVLRYSSFFSKFFLISFNYVSAYVCAEGIKLHNERERERMKAAEWKEKTNIKKTIFKCYIGSFMFFCRKKVFHENSFSFCNIISFVSFILFIIILCCILLFTTLQER